MLVVLLISRYQTNSRGVGNMNAYDKFMQSVYKPMREDLVQSGFTELTTEEEVQVTMEKLEGSALIVINSVCGCAAGQARPAVREALEEVQNKPDHLFTVFAGQDKEATEKMESIFSGSSTKLTLNCPLERWSTRLFYTEGTN